MVHSRKKAYVVAVPIRIELDQASEGTWYYEEPRPKKGKVVTETFTEYKEVQDDADFAGFGHLDAAKYREELSKLQLEDGKAKKKEITHSKKGASKTKSDSSSSASSSDEEEEMERFEQDALKAHNEYRKKHNVKPLKLSKKLCKFAQEWAEKLAKEDKFEHRPKSDYGENLYCSWSSNPKAKISGSQPVDSWYAEVTKHTFGEEPKTMGSSHFSQVVWKGSKEFGIGKSKSKKSGKFIVVATYDPPGNYIGKYTDNVLPPRE